MSKSDVVESSLTRQRSKPVKSSYSSTPKRTRTVATTSAFTDDLVVNTPTTESIKQNTKMAVSFLNDEPVEMPEANNETWFFHCRCGLSGINLDDGFPMIECGSCKKWSHIACAITTKSGKPCTSAQVQKWEANDYTCPKCTIKARRKSAAAIKTFKSSPSTLSAAAFPGDAQYLASDDDVSDRSQLGLPLSMKTKKRRVVSDMNAKPTQKQPVSQTFTYSPSANEPVWNNNVMEMRG
ncbi:hypothetical protein BDEG_21420 [Batrachochytrium dendrobatidis JEL423]|uniref:PHD-type domain-containing protein n=1 Tax=Batrachochytrium dendrobatidis (strain JEL423) TaxID=403673 RepID=A0A177WBB3_BATDL|nr:hypothetical protein BDEG_21420 [Batrachochytrium dendrobatidis JEL423]